MSRDFEERLRHALHHEAERVDHGVADPLGDVRRRAHRQTRNRWVAAGLCVAAVLVVAGGALTPLLRGDMTVELDPDPVAPPPSEEEAGDPDDAGPGDGEQDDAGEGEPGDGEPDGSTGTDGQSADEGPALAQECTDAENGYTIRYPEGWHTNSGTESPASPCAYFHPEPFTLPDVAREVTDKAVSVFVDSVPFEVTSDPAGRETKEVLVQEEIRVAGREAVRYETVASGEGMFPEGTRHYTYVVNAGGGRSLFVTTRDQVPDVDYEEVKAVIDRMVDSLRLDDAG